MKIVIIIALAAVVVAGCDKPKMDAAVADTGAPTTIATTAAGSDVPAAPNAAGASATDHVAIAKAAAAAGGVTAEVPSHEDHATAAAAEIHKGNYKKEMDSLEKDLK
jgi:PBP1b-binding outer membrane lipoprotein LpoB